MEAPPRRFSNNAVTETRVPRKTQAPHSLFRVLLDHCKRLPLFHDDHFFLVALHAIL